MKGSCVARHGPLRELLLASSLSCKVVEALSTRPRNIRCRISVYAPRVWTLSSLSTTPSLREQQILDYPDGLFPAPHPMVHVLVAYDFAQHR